MRLFLALDVSQETRDYLTKVQAMISRSKSKLALTTGFHITLKFLGEIDDKHLKLIRLALSNLEFEEFEFKILGLGTFGKATPRIIWAGLDSHDEIRALKKKIEDLLPPVFTKQDRVKFTPHITIARVKKLESKENMISQIKECEKKELVTKVKSVVLYKSTLTPHGSIYNVVSRFKAKPL